MKLLIADDEAVIRHGLMSLDWNEIGITEIYSAVNGIEAKELLANEDIDIVISDIRMPGLDGLELSRYLYETTKDTVIILLTGFNDFEYAKEAIRNQVYEYLLKPVHPEELLTAVRRAVETIKQKKYKNQMLRQYQDQIAAYDITEKILHSFLDVGIQMTDILTVIAKRSNTDLTLSDLAEEYHFSPIYLSRFIKKETGYSFIDILTGIRLMHAASMLEEGKERIQSICEKTGFRDQRYFSQVFKRIFECTPRDYRKNGSGKRYETIVDILDAITVKHHTKGGD